MSHSFALNSGDRMPALGLGTWKSAPGEVGQALREALRVGYRHIDCAAIYDNEPEIGQAFHDAFLEKDVRREDLWVTSKLWNSNHRADDVMPALKKTLKDLNLDYLDLYLMHWPVAFQPGVTFPRTPDQFLRIEDAPLSETWTAMEAAVDAGLCRNIGVSNFTETKIEEVLGSARIVPAVNQVELHPILAQPGLLEWCSNKGIHLTAYSPLGSNDRPDALKRSDEPRPLEDTTIHAIAKNHSATPGQILLAWAMQRGTSVIPKSVNPGRIRENFEAARIELSTDDMSAIAALDRHERIVTGSFFSPPGSPYTTAWLWS